MKFQSVLPVAAGIGLLGMTSIATLAADLGAAPANPSYKTVPAAVFSWTGFYVGGNVGYGWADTSVPGFAGTERLSGVIGGAQAGYNWQTGNWVVGLETDFQYSGQQHKTVTVAGAVTMEQTDKLSWLGTTRVRAGFAADRWYFYGTGGVAYGEGKVSGSATALGVSVPFGGSGSKVGWTAGAGVEAALGRNWSWKTEYLYADLGTVSIAVTAGGVPVGTGTVKVHDQIVRTGVNYRF